MTPSVDNGWILTFSGKKFWPMNPRIEDVDIHDIAHALSNICRFTGHVRVFYSVGEHCVRACAYAPADLKLAMLLHDASEAYLCDISRPVKHGEGFERYREAEKRLEGLIAQKYGFSMDDLRIHEIDNRMLMTERRDLMAPHPDGWEHWSSVSAYPDQIHPVSPLCAERLFLQMFDQLSNR